ncbi:MAG: DUF5667 domain-containing protein [Chloroflexi bacterium]|nr:DUF5667 domain-containing protein [Chloroflexota bacterium]
MDDGRNLEQILDDCLNDVAQGRATVEQYLTHHREFADELLPLLKLAQDIAAVPDVRPSPAFKRATRARLVALPPSRSRYGERRRVLHVLFGSARLAPLALALLLVVLLGAGTLHAANDALPGSPLYPIKRAIERIQFSRARDAAEQARLHLALADRRLTETLALTGAGDAERAAQSARAYSDEVNAALRLVTANSALAPEVAEQLSAQRTRIQSQAYSKSSAALTEMLTTSASALEQLQPTPAPVASATATPSATSVSTSELPTATSALFALPNDVSTVQPSTILTALPNVATTTLPVVVNTPVLPAPTLAVPTNAPLPPTSVPVLPTSLPPLVPASPTATRFPALPTNTPNVVTPTESSTATPLRLPTLPVPNSTGTIPALPTVHLP